MIYTIEDMKQMNNLTQAGLSYEDAIDEIRNGSVMRVAKRDVRLLMNLVCDYFEVTPEQVWEQNRKEQIVLCRAFVSYILSMFTNFPDDDVAMYIRRDRCTVLHHRRKIQGLIEIGDESYIGHFENLKDLIKERFVV